MILSLTSWQDDKINDKKDSNCKKRSEADAKDHSEHGIFALSGQMSRGRHATDTQSNLILERTFKKLLNVPINVVDVLCEPHCRQIKI